MLRLEAGINHPKTYFEKTRNKIENMRK